jgi:hypothetical protein
MPLLTLPKPIEIIKNWFFWLIIITFTAIILRSLPAWTNAAWGCDFGIYYGLTNSFVHNQELFNPYYGWGGSYQYFPVLYAVTGTLHWITGIDVLTIMPKIAPIFGGLSIMIFYFVVYELLGDRKKALLSSLLFAVMPFHVYQTSHASPLTIGHFFMMLSIYLFIKFRQDTRFILPLFISTTLLIMSHHLTTYFYLISLTFIVFVENASIKEWTLSLKKDVLYIISASGLVFSYWRFIATPVYDSFMMRGFNVGIININSGFTIILFYILFFSIFGFVWLKRRFNLFIIREKPTVKSAIVKFFLTVTICLMAMGIFSVIKLPWTNFSFTSLSIIYSLPLIFIFAFGVAGFRYTRFIRNGNFIRGWLLAILISFVYGLLTNNSTILPHRHFEYIMAPLSIISIFGISGIFLKLNYERISKLTKRFHHINKSSFYYYFNKSNFLQKRQLIYIAVILFLVSANAVSVYPSHIALNASYEAITNENFAVIEWMDDNFDNNNSVIASDHRLARITEAVGFNTTLDESSVIWISKNFTDYIHELEGIGKNHSRITHVIIDDIMKDKVVHVGFGKIFYMTNESYEKFSYPPFDLSYRNATLNQDMEEEHWTEVYTVNWTFIGEFLEKI